MQTRTAKLFLSLLLFLGLSRASVAVAQFPMPGAAPSPFAYITVPEKHIVAAMDTKFHFVIKEVSFGASKPAAVGISADQKSAYVALQNENRIAVVNTATHTISHYITMPSAILPRHIQAAPNGAYFYVTEALQVGGLILTTLHVFDARANVYVKKIETLGWTLDPNLAISSDSEFVYMNGGLFVWILRSSNMEVTYISMSPYFATALALTPNGKYLVTTGATTSIIDTATKTFALAPFDLGVGAGAQVAITPDGAYALISSVDSGMISVLDINNRRVVGTIPFEKEKNPGILRINALGTLAYSVNHDAGTVSVIDVPNRRLLGHVRPAFCYQASYIALTGSSILPVWVPPPAPGEVSTATLANTQGYSVSFFNTQTKLVNKTLALGREPFAVASSCLNTYVVDDKDNTLSIIDNRTQTLKQTLTMGSGPIAVTVGPNEKTYVANSLSNTVSIVNNGSVTATVSVGLRPSAVTTLPDGRAVVANSGSGSLSFIDANNQVVKTLSLGQNGTTLPQAIVAKPDGTRVYLANFGTNNVAIVNPATYAISRVNVGVQPIAIAISPNGAFVYTANQGNGTVTKINTATGNAVATISLGFLPGDLEFSRDGLELYVTLPRENRLAVINTADNSVRMIERIGTAPRGIAITSGGKI